MLSAKQKEEIRQLQEAIEELHTLGLTDSEIARRLNRPAQTINRHRNQMGLKTHRVKRQYDNEIDRMKGYILRNSKSSAKVRNIAFELDHNDIPSLPEYCPLIPSLKLTYKGESDGNSDCHASLDRIDSRKGYVKGNVQIISRLANTIKSDANFEQLKEFCTNMLLFIENRGARGDVTDSESLDH
jgi:hypothetical protein